MTSNRRRIIVLVSVGATATVTGIGLAICAFIGTGALAGVSLMLLVIVCATLFWHVSNRLLRSMVENEQRLRQAMRQVSRFVQGKPRQRVRASKK